MTNQIAIRGDGFDTYSDGVQGREEKTGGGHHIFLGFGIDQKWRRSSDKGEMTGAALVAVNLERRAVRREMCPGAISWCLLWASFCEAIPPTAKELEKEKEKLEQRRVYIQACRAKNRERVRAQNLPPQPTSLPLVEVACEAAQRRSAASGARQAATIISLGFMPPRSAIPPASTAVTTAAANAGFSASILKCRR
jgi:hypothetical protein